MNEYTELIEKYLLGQMGATEKIQFEAQLKTDKKLQMEFEVQKQLMKVIDKMGLKTQLKDAAKNYQLKQLLLKGAIAVIGAALIVSAVIFANKYYNSSSNLNEEGNTLVADGVNRNENKNKIDEAVTKTSDEPVTSHTNDKKTYQYISAPDTIYKTPSKTFTTAEIINGADTNLPLLNYHINNDKNTIFETPSGMLVAVEAGSFINKSGKQIDGYVDVEIKEALVATDIIKAGLSTTSNGELLETGGMFYINVKQDGEDLQMTKNIQIKVPTNSKKENMMLFDGERMTNGSINWVAPKPIDEQLITYDIDSLDFYPTGYINKVKELGLNYDNKTYTDSLYYSFSGFRYKNLTVQYDDFKREKPRKYRKRTSIGFFKGFFGNRDTAKVESSSNLEIDPARIAAIWNKKYNKTIIATKEFEARLKYIFSTCNYKYIDLYTNNLQKNLYEIDSMCMAIATQAEKQKFEKFYQHKDGGVKITNELQYELNLLASQRLQMYRKAASDAWNVYRKREAELDAKALKIQGEHGIKEIMRNNTTFQEEYCMNLINAYQQLGQKYKCPMKNPRITIGFYSVNVSNSGWSNLDRYAFESTRNRTTLDYTDKATGKRAVIRYEPVTISIEDEAEFNSVMVYMIPNSLSSFQRINKVGNIYKENLNELLEYDIVAVGYKGGEVYTFKIANANKGSYTLTLKKTSEMELKKLLETNSKSKTNDLESELYYQQFMLEEKKRLEQRKQLDEMRNAIADVIFPCGDRMIKDVGERKVEPKNIGE